MNPRIATAAVFSLAAALILSTCSANGGSIYATIETEQKVNSGTLPDYLVIADITKATTDNYYIAAGAVFKGILSGTTASMTWDPTSDSATTYRPYNDHTSSGSSMLCNALATFNSNLYGGFYTAGGTEYRLSWVPVSSISSSGTGTPWVTLALPNAASSEQVTHLEVANGTLYVGGTVVASSGNLYELDLVNGTTSVSQLTTLSLTTPVTNVVYAGSTYLVSTTNKVYASSSPSFSSSSDVTPSAIGSDLINGMYSDGTNVFVMTKASGLFYSTNQGTSWVQVAAPVVSSVTVSLLTAAGPYGNTYFIGSDGYGYYTYTLGGSLTRFTDTTVALYAESVRRILIDGTHLFMGTNATGLWGGELSLDSSSNAVVSDWTHEQKT